MKKETKPTTTPLQQKALYYFVLGLNSKEISKLIEIPFRTVQNWIFYGKWKTYRKAPNLITIAKDYHKKGYSRKTIANIMNISPNTVSKWVHSKD